MKKIILQLLCLTLSIQPLFAQLTREENPLLQIASNNKGSNWYIFDKGIMPSAANINSPQMKTYFGFDSNNSFEMVKAETDELKITHQTFQQRYKGYPVQFAQFRLHEFPDKPLEGNGHFISNFSQTIPTVLTFLQALDRAKQYFPAQVYMWQDTMEEASLKRRSHERKTTYYPKEELVWAISNRKLRDMRVDNYSLAYKIVLAGKIPFFTKEIYIDARTGNLINEFERDYNCGSQSFSSNFNGTKSVSYQNTGLTHKLVDDCGLGDDIYTSDNGTSASPYSKASTASWPTTNNFKSACTSLWALREAQKYYFNIHSRNGWDTIVSDVDLRQNAIFYRDKTPPLDSPYYFNASFNNVGICLVGNNQSSGPNGANTTVNDDVNTLDVLAHEMTHGVTFSSSGLVYNGEPGALNESFSDIFGINVYQYVGGYSAANLWKIGYDMTNGTGAHLVFRDMADPHSHNDPNTYLTDTLWRDTTATADDKGGVHHNSGVQNYMYYLLVQGGSGTNENGLSYSLTGIGFTAARGIAYRALTAGYLNANSNHDEARSAWVHAAIDLYGNCSVQSQAVGKAWEAVGVGSYWYYGNNICGNYSGTQYFKNNSPYFISTTACATTIMGTGNQVTFDGGDFVNISPGFNTNTGAFFTAKTNDCFYSNY